MTDIYKDPEFFLFIFKGTAVDYNVDLSTDEKRVAAFELHKQKLKEVCSLLAYTEMCEDSPAKHRRVEMLCQRIQVLKSVMRHFVEGCDKGTKSLLWVRHNNEKYKMAHGEE